MKKIALLLLVTPCFASTHYVSQTVKPTAKLALDGAKVASYPVRHPASFSKGFGKGVAAVVKTVF